MLQTHVNNYIYNNTVKKDVKIASHPSIISGGRISLNEVHSSRKEFAFIGANSILNR